MNYTWLSDKHPLFFNLGRVPGCVYPYFSQLWEMMFLTVKSSLHSHCSFIQIHCHQRNVCILPSSYGEALIFSVTVLEGEVWQYLGHEGRALIIGIRAFVRTDMREMISPCLSSVTWGYSKKTPRKRVLTRTQLATWSWTSKPSE